MKKIITILLTLTFCLSMAACGKMTQEDQEKYIREQLIDEFVEKAKNEHPDWEYAGYSGTTKVDLKEVGKWEVNGRIEVDFFEGEENYTYVGEVLYYPEEGLYDSDLIIN